MNDDIDGPRISPPGAGNLIFMLGLIAFHFVYIFVSLTSMFTLISRHFHHGS